jgi:hypothetical protein
MMEEKRTWIVLFIVLTLIVILAGCSGLPKIAQLGIVVDPNPVPCSSEDGRWYFTMNISESNGVGVTVTSLTFTYYTQENQLIGTESFDAETFFGWFETDYIPAFSTIQSVSNYLGTPGYSIATVAGVDDNDNPVEATVRIDYLPQ